MIPPPLPDYTRLRLNFLSLADACLVLADHFNITMREMTERHEGTGGLMKRNRSVQRRSIWWHLRQVRMGAGPKWSYLEIAREFGVVHSSVIEAVRKIDGSMGNV
jgi:chromosomal replication initiation ATPase DnaA